jgi:hypothetical protein
MDLFSLELIDLSELESSAIFEHNGCGNNDGNCSSGCGCANNDGNCGGN